MIELHQLRLNANFLFFISIYIFSLNIIYRHFSIFINEFFAVLMIIKSYLILYDFFTFLFINNFDGKYYDRTPPIASEYKIENLTENCQYEDTSVRDNPELSADLILSLIVDLTVCSA